MRSNRIPRRRSQPGQRLNHARREPSFDREITQLERREGRQFRGLHDDATSGGECWADFPCPHEHWLRKMGQRRYVG